MKEYLKRGAVSFAISSFVGLIVNLIIDLIVNACSEEKGFISMSPEFRDLFPTPAAAAYVNIILYGLIGATFAFMTFIFDIERLGFLVQSILYFLLTGIILTGITILLWQLHRYPRALIPTITGYGMTYLIMGTMQYRELKEDIRKINDTLVLNREEG